MSLVTAPIGGSGRFVARRPTVLCFGGVDPSGGAGLTRDAIVADRLCVHPLLVPTALTVQTTLGVRETLSVSGPLVAKMATAVLDDFRVAAVKVGMLATDDVATHVARVLDDHATGPVVVDPVLQSGSGNRLLTRVGVQVLKRHIVPQATVLTPNLQEAESLSDVTIASMRDLKRAAAKLKDMGASWVLVKAGRLPGGPLDLLFDGERSLMLRGEPLDADSVHGTGCIFSTAIACFLAKEVPVPEAVRRAKGVAEHAIRSAEMLGGGMLIPGGGDTS